MAIASFFTAVPRSIKDTMRPAWGCCRCSTGEGEIARIIEYGCSKICNRPEKDT
jgi:hypothetical protein